MAAVTSIAAELDLWVDHALVLQNSNKLALRLLPCDVLARVAVGGPDVAALEVDIGQQLGARGCPVAALEPRVQSRVYESDGFAVTLWTFYEAVSERHSAPEYADALHRLHVGMSRVDVMTPHFTDRVSEAERLVTERGASPGLTRADRRLLIDTLHSTSLSIRACQAREQLLHGEPHPGNVLSTRNGPLFVDLETCCSGPVEFDVAHVPHDVAALYVGVDRMLLEECRRLVLAMVAAWRWDVRDEFPNGQQHARDLLSLLRNGPPWPVLGSLTQ
jgi:Phosphotransferase enzyme family